MLPSRPRILVGAISNNQISLEIAQLGLLPLLSLVLNHKFTTLAVITLH